MEWLPASVPAFPALSINYSVIELHYRLPDAIDAGRPRDRTTAEAVALIATSQADAA